MLSAVLIASGLYAGSSLAQAQSGATLTSPPQAFTSALAAFDDSWASSGLAFTTVTFTDGASTGYGQYTPRDGNAFADGEALSVYAEPVGYGFKESADGYAYALTASYRLLNASGQVLAEQDNFASFSGGGRSKKRELSAALTFQFSGLPAGTYTLETRFSDEVGAGQAEFALPFTVSGTN
jgi:Flp pilus assembly protein TadG